MEILSSLTQISAKFSSFFSLAKILFSEKFFRENFHKKIFIFLCENFLFFSFLFLSSLSCIYILYISKTVKQPKTFGRNFCGFSALALHFSNQQKRPFTVKRGYFDRL